MATRTHIASTPPEPGDARAIRLRRGASLHPVEDSAILFDADTQHLYAANTTSAFIWCCFEEGLPATEAAARLGAAFGLATADAEAFVRDALRQWTSLDLIEDAANAAPRRPRPAPSSVVESWTEPAVGPFRVETARTYRLLDSCFRFRFASAAVERELHPFLESLADAPIAGEDPVIVDVREQGHLRALCHKGRVVERWVAREELVPTAKIALVALALDRSGDFGAIHAAAVAPRPGAPCVVIAGVSGSGKSTLTAALAADGLLALGDDTVVLSRETLTARPVPFGICVKDGAWELLSARVPDCATAPVHRRLDGKIVRYLVSPSRRFARGARHPIAAVVFPRRRAGVEPRLVPLARADALQRLLSEFCPLGGPLTPETVDDLARWIRAVGCFELRYGSLDDGTRLIGELCA
ncbi:MAG: PqqD family peptide modification chaperone [Gemmatimonas sp.]